MSVRARLLITNLVLVALLLIGFGVAARMAARSFVSQGAQRELERRLDNARGGPPRGGPRPPDFVQRQPYFPLWLDLEGHPIMEDETRSPWDEQAVLNAEKGQGSRTSVQGEEALLVATERVQHDDPRPGDFAGGPPQVFIVQVAVPLGDMTRILRDLDRAFLLLVPFALVLSGLISWILTGRVLQPVNKIREAASRMDASNLSERLPQDSTDEFGQLAASFNQLLERIQISSDQREQLVNQLKRFTADASHELKTPLTVIKGISSLKSGKNLSETESAEAFGEIDKAAGRMQRLVQDLLLLAKADEGQLDQAKTEITIQDLVASAHLEAGKPAFELHFDSDGAWKVNENQVVRVLKNLIENASRYSTNRTVPVIRVTGK